MKLNEFRESCPRCGGPAFSDSILAEKKDACYYKVKASAKVWPSAYASGRLVQCRKKGAANYGNKSESIYEAGSPAQQAAIAINMQKHHKKPKHMSEDSDKQDMAEGERTMSRAAKGNEKYGKDGMKALAKAGREGASDEKLDKIRDKHDTYNEEWSKKYKSSINCSHPKGFSQKAHCAGKKKRNESIEMEMTCPDCGMCETHIGDQNLHEACWKGYHKEGNKELFGKTVPNCVKNEDISQDETSQPNTLDLLRSWRNRVPAQYAWHLTKTFGDPHDVTNDLIIWHDKDGFKRIEIKDEYVMHTSPTPHYDYCYSYIDLKVPHKLSVYLADCSESILIDHLKNEVGARCASLAANAVTLNFVMDVIAGRARPSRDEYEQRIMDMHHDFENKKIFTIQWWPDQSHDTDPANPYYKQQRKSKSDMMEDKRIARKAGQPANSKKHSDLYTDENPRGTIKGLKFATVEDARASVGKIRSSGRSHAHKVQAAVAMEQRARAAGKASAAAVYRAYINSVKKTTEAHHEETTMTENQDELARILELGTGLSTQARAELHEEFDLIESIIEGVAEHNGVDTDVIWEDLESLTDDELYVFAVTTPIMESEAWQKANKRDKTDGMSQKAVNAYRREHPGSKLKTAVTTKPSKLKKGSKASKRRKSYCSRSRGQMKMHSISCAKTPDKAICKARRRWNC